MSGKILINSEALSHSYLPEKLFHRDRELAQLLRNMKNSVNTFVHGPCGSGKTSIIRHAVRDFDSVKERAVYVDCCLYQTTNSVLREVLYALNVPIFCRSNYDLINRLKARAKSSKIIICLDHFEKLKEVELIDKIVGLNLCVIVVSDKEESLARLDPSTKSSFASIIQIPKYSVKEVFDIIKDRAEEALKQGSYTDAIVKRMVERSNGNISLAINMLKSAALKAESENRARIEETDIPKNDCPEHKLNQDEKTLLKILKEWKSLPASRLYDFYVQNSRYPKGERSFRNYMEKLCSKGLVRALGEKRGRIYEVVEDAKGNG